MPQRYVRRLSNDDENALRKQLHESQSGNCFICGKPLDWVLHADTMEIDHITPTSAGGKDSPDNFALTHRECNRSKQASNLEVARVMASFGSLASDNRAPNLGDVLGEHGGSKFDLPIEASETALRISYPDIGSHDIETLQVYTDKLSDFRSAFIDLPIEYLHHDDEINPRAIGANLRKLVEEFHKRLPQLHISLGWIDTKHGNRVKVKLFDGQHKAAAQIFLGARTLPVRVFIDPDRDILLTANTNAGTKLRQVAFSMSVQRTLGNRVLIDRMDRFREEHGLDPDDESFSERDLVEHFKGESRQLRKYVVDRVRTSITNHPDNKLTIFIDDETLGPGGPIGYWSIERAFFKFFIYGKVLTTPFNYRLDDEANPRILEIEQTVRLMNIIAEEIYIDSYDWDHASRRIEREVQDGKHVSDRHLRCVRMSKEEILYNWVSLVRQVVVQSLLFQGKSIMDPEKVFEQRIPEVCWENVGNFIRALKRLPLWVNRDLSVSHFAPKRNYDYWEAIFTTGSTPDGVTVIPSGGLNVMEMIRGDE